MDSELIVAPPPDEADIERLHRQVATLAEALAGREQELGEMRLALARFEVRYHQEVSSRYARLDDLKARIAEARARLAPRDPWLGGRAQRARAAAEQTARSYQSFRAETLPPEPEVEIPAETRRLYRHIAAEIHPDKACDETSRDLRTRLMAELNEAFTRGDRERMEEILRHWQSSPETVVGQDTAAIISRLERTRERLRGKLAHTERTLHQLRNSELHVLMASAREAERTGRNLLRELAQAIEEQIEEAGRELAGLTRKPADD
ncbi:hypothetical protein DESUT3_06960 [Desulfuromonas versatilis]|uniref:Molecular chaperone DnaJ n=1 Tax=Desulfuromonas versatilis TaxID=2802975 RepID=A0ABN6DU40_9BACT|nr:hypothetical protein [Desulfuromonas versatilis]BCR03627.1 hypothetical protein DESUT3_06960 [Desulfuromonas versatilis]